MTFIWTDGNVAHCAEHGVTTDDVELVFARADASEVQTSRSTGRPVLFGETPDGRTIFIAFEWADDERITVYPITAYEA